MLQRMLQARLQAAFSCWQERGAELATKRAAAARAVAHLQDRLLWGAFSSWLEAVQGAQQAREHNSRALQFWTNRAAAAAFATWQPWAAERRLLRDRLQGARLHAVPGGVQSICVQRAAFHLQLTKLFRMC